MSIKDIQFPVYKIGVSKPIEDNGLLYYEYKDEDSGIITRYILDDKSIEQDTLAKRRLYLLAKGVKLRKLDTAIFFLGDFIKLADSVTWFVDSVGKLFQHKKSIMSKLIFKKINRVIPIPSGGAIIEVEGISTRFKVLFAPTNEIYAGLLKIGRMYILYGLSQELPNSTWRRV